MAEHNTRLLEPSSYDIHDLEVSSSDDEPVTSVRSSGPTSYFRSFPHHRPLIDFVKNEWQANGSFHNRSASSHASSSPNRQSPRWIQIVTSIVSAPKFRRYLTVYLILLSLFWGCWKGIVKPQLEEHAALVKALDVASQERVGGWFGTNARPPLADIIQLRTLDSSLLPGDVELGPNDRGRRRLVIVGDVHGCKDELEALLRKVSFDARAGDHLILTGDIIHQGPHSAEIVDLAQRLHASCVRGNHEDRILLLRRRMSLDHQLDSSDKDDFSRSDDSHRQVARELSDDQAAWLEECPVILKLGQIKGIGNVVVAHGGLVPGVNLENQDPSSVMNMRTIDLDTHVPSSSRNGMAWTKLYNKYQSLVYKNLETTGNANPESGTMTVVYGHDAASSLNIKPYTKGLDSGCVKGKKLTALVIEDGGKQQIVQVRCKNYQQG